MYHLESTHADTIDTHLSPERSAMTQRMCAYFQHKIWSVDRAGAISIEGWNDTAQWGSVSYMPDREKGQRWNGPDWRSIQEMVNAVNPK